MKDTAGGFVCRLGGVYTLQAPFLPQPKKVFYPLEGEFTKGCLSVAVGKVPETEWHLPSLVQRVIIIKALQ